MSQRKIQRYGWKPDLPDHRDHMFAAPPPAPEGLPVLKNLRPLVKTVFDQGQLGSCTGNSIAQAFMVTLTIEKKPMVPMSRLFIYYNERVMEGDPGQDNGAQIRDGLKSVASQGVCIESDWPYDITKFAVKPPAKAYQDAKAHRALRYMSVPQSLSQMKACLAAGYPFVYGFSVYESFESDAVATSGNAPMPSSTEAMIGGHAVLAVGYNDGPDLKLPNGQVWPSNTFLTQNSWGTGWGLQADYAGCFTIPYSYLQDANLASDFWTIRMDT